MENDKAPDRVRLTEADARALIQRGRAAITKALEAMAELRAVLPPLWEGRAWTVLGYESWEAMCQAEFGIRLPRVERKQLAGELAAGGMGVRAIAFGLGVDPATISRDLQPSPTVANATPGPIVANATPGASVANATPEPEPMTYERWLTTTGIPTLTEEEFADVLTVIAAELEAVKAEAQRAYAMADRQRTWQDNAEELAIRSGHTPPETRLKYPRIVAAARAAGRAYRARCALLRLGLCLPEHHQVARDCLVGVVEDYDAPASDDPDKLAAHAELERIADGETWNRMDRAVVAAALDILLAPKSAVGSEQPAE